MKIRGDFKIYGDAFAPNTGNSVAGEGKVLTAHDADGKLVWKDVFIPQADTLKTYDKNSVVLNSTMDSTFIAIVDGAPGNALVNVSKWLRLGGSASSGGNIFHVDISLPDTARTLPVGNVISSYPYAASFKDINGNADKTVDQVLNAILFKEGPSIPKEGSLVAKLMGRYDGAAVYVNIAGKTFEYGKPMDVRLDALFYQGEWVCPEPSNTKSYYGPAQTYKYNMQGGTTVVDIPATTAGADSFELAAAGNLDKISTYDYISTVSYAGGEQALTEYGHPQTCPATGSACQQAADSISAPKLSFSAGAPILLAMLPISPASGALEAYLNRADIKPLLKPLHEGGTDFLEVSPDVEDVTNTMAGTVKYPYILIPSSLGSSIKEFKDYASNVDYTSNFNNKIDVSLDRVYGSTGYGAYVFKSLTSVVPGSNIIKLTIN